MMRRTAEFCWLLIVYYLGCSTTSADKDDSYYIAGTGNPNTKESMYWKDAENVLQDLSKFSSLHVEFHQCAWTWMQWDNEEDNDVEENDYWYMGKIPPMGANVAFSLYGSLKGRTFGGCKSDTFINSFYTNTGFEVFAQAMYNAGVSGFGSYSYGDDDSSSSLSSACLGYKGIGCDSKYGFALHTYSTALCDPKSASGIKDQLVYLNKAMNASQCVKIYDSSSYSSSYNNQGDDDAQQEQQDDSSPLSLLYHSSACFYQNFWSPDGECPDPYGKIKSYQQNFYNGIQIAKTQRPVSVYRQKQIYEAAIRKGQSRLVIGIVCVVASVALLVVDKILSMCRKRRERAKLAQQQAERADPMMASVGSTSPSNHSSREFEYMQY